VKLFPVSDSPSRAQTALERILGALSRPSERRSRLVEHIEVVDSWTEGDDVFCLIYRDPEEYDFTLGLRRTGETDWTIDGVVDQVLVGELGEPLGALEDTLRADDKGVMWWTGDQPEWRGPPR
jgi:hypothetical protein